MIWVPGMTGTSFLSLVALEPSDFQSPVTLEYRLEGSDLIFNFKVLSPKIYANPNLSAEQFPYMYDVVEVFLSVDGSRSYLPYFEFELSPLGQTFELKIIEPRENTVPGINMGLDYQVKKFDGGWEACMKVPLAALDWSGDPQKLIGNAYAILGESPERLHWSLFPLKQEKVDFHRPEFFQSFFNGSNRNGIR